MNKRFYVDTAIWRDYYENREDNLRPIGEWAFAFLNKALSEKDIILYSHLIEEELRVKYKQTEIDAIFSIIEDTGLLQKVEIGQIQIKEAAKLCKQKSIAFGDALHTILARDNNATLITRDRHFLELLHIAEIKKPEELL